jgi:signal transduction histidine kinase
LSLRSKILALYVALALAPMVALGVGSYIQSTRSVAALVTTKLQATGQEVAAEIRAGHAALSTSLSFLSDFAGPPMRPSAGMEPWRSLLETFTSIEYRDQEGRVGWSVGSVAPIPSGDCVAADALPVEVTVPVRGAAGSEIAGLVPAAALLTGPTLNVQFGQSGRTFVLDRVSGKPVFGACAGSGAPRLANGEPLDGETLSRIEGSLSLIHEGTGLEAIVAEVRDVPWVVVVSTDPREFTAPYAKMQAAYLGLVLFIALGAGGAFLILAQHFMASLEELTLAAERIGEGDMSPWLPPPSEDEVGRLSSAFSRMLERLKATMRQSQAAWQAAAVGGVASQLSHEIRNPLSSIRLNLQSLEREVRAGRTPDDLPEVLSVCMREIERLNDAVSGVLEFGRPSLPRQQPCRLSAVVDESLALIRPRLERAGIDVRWAAGQVDDRILADPSQLRGVFLNLFLNAADAMAGGGQLRIWLDNPRGRSVVRAHVADDGPGVSADVRAQIFEPFFTTRAAGSGIGLAVARQTIEAHGGTLDFAQRSELETGAEFVIVLPLQQTGAVTPPPGMDRQAKSGESPERLRQRA